MGFGEAHEAVAAELVRDVVAVLLPELAMAVEGVFAVGVGPAELVVEEAVAADEVFEDDDIGMLLEGFGAASIDEDGRAPNPEGVRLIEEETMRRVGSRRCACRRSAG